MIRKVKSGLIHVNCYGGSDVTVPLGGMKQSGNGYDKVTAGAGQIYRGKNSLDKSGRVAR